MHKGHGAPGIAMSCESPSQISQKHHLALGFLVLADESGRQFISRYDIRPLLSNFETGSDIGYSSRSHPLHARDETKSENRKSDVAGTCNVVDF